jgi:L-lactate utilization protein LutB
VTTGHAACANRFAYARNVAGSDRDERDRARRNMGTVLGRDGRPVRAPEAIFYEMLTCERCGASFPACGQCPFCRRPS